MISHTYHIHLNSTVIHLPDADDLVGKDVEVIVRERKSDTVSNVNTLKQLLTKANPDFFKQIADPITWQQHSRDEWE